MKPLRLQIEGINSFKERQTIDFERLSRGGMFGVFGPTGSGKSTILDSIFLALYSKMERASAMNYSFINIEMKEAYVSLMFDCAEENKEKVYLVERKYKKTGSRKFSEQAELFSINNGNQVLITDVKEEVDSKIEAIIGFKYQDFKRCVSLTQGEYNEFMKGDHLQKVDMIERIFSLEKYGTNALTALNGKISKLSFDIHDLEVKLSGFNDLEPRMQTMRDDIEEISAAYDKKRIEKAEKKLMQKSGDILIEKVNRHAEKRGELKLLEQKGETFAKLYDRIAAAKRARDIMPTLENLLGYEKKVERFSNSLKEMKEKLSIKEQLKVIESKRYNDFEEVVEESLERIAKRKEHLIFIKSDYEDCQKLKAELLGEEWELDELRDRLESLQTEKDNLQELYDKSSSYIESLNMDSSNLSITQENVKIISIIKEIEQRVEFENENLDSQKAKLNRLNADIEDYQSLLEADDEAIKAAEIAYNNACSELRACGYNLSNVYADFVENANLTSQNIYKAEFLEFIDSNIAELEKQKLELEARLASEEDAKVGAQKLENQVTEDAQRAEVTLGNARLKKEEYMWENMITLLSNRLEVGTECKFCGNQITQVIHDDSVSLRPIEEEIAELQENLNRIFLELGASQTTVGERFGRINEIKERIAAVGMLLVTLKGRRDALNVGHESLEKFKAFANDQRAELARHINLIREYTEKKNAYDAKISAVAKKRARLDEKREQSRKLDEAIATLTVNAQTLTSKLDAYNDEFSSVKNKDLYEILFGEGMERTETLIKLTQQKEVFKICEKHITDIAAEILQTSQSFASLSAKIEASKAQMQTLTDKVSVELAEDESVYTAIENLELEENILLEKLELYHERYHKISDIINIIDKSLSEREITYKTMQKELATNKAEAVSKLQGSGFASVDELRNAYIGDDEIEKITMDIKAYERLVERLRGECAELEKQTVGLDMSKSEVISIGEAIAVLDVDIKELERELYIKREDLARAEDSKKEERALAAKLSELSGLMKRYNRAHALLKDKKLLSYVAMDYINKITHIATDILKKISGGRYNLKYADGFYVVDNMMSGEMRDVLSLSGGETFLVSLSVSMAMSISVSQMAENPVKLLFFDEGFGTLDEELVEIVGDALRKLNESNITIGLISHVSELQHKVDEKIVMRPATNTMGSVVSYM